MDPSTSPSSISHTHPTPFIVLPLSHPHNSTLVLLHGTSQTGHELANLLLSLPLPDTTQTLPQALPYTKIVFPTGSPKHTTVLGKLTNSWFDIHSFSDRTVGEDGQIPGLTESIIYLKGLIEEEFEELVKSGVESEEARGRIVVGGFSSGAALAVLGALSGEWDGENGEIGGVVGMSGWLPFRIEIEGVIDSIGKGEDSRAAVRDHLRGSLELGDRDERIGGVMRQEGGKWKWTRMKVLLCHGVKDVKVRHEWGIEKSSVLDRVGLDVRWKEYEALEHWVCADEMRDLKMFLTSIWGD